MNAVISSVRAFRSAPSPRPGPRQLICVGERVTSPVVTCQAVPSTRRPPHLVIRATIWPPAAGGMLLPVPSLPHRPVVFKFCAVIQFYALLCCTCLLIICRLQEDPPPGVSASPTENNIMLWNAIIFGLVFLQACYRPVIFRGCQMTWCIVLAKNKNSTKHGRI